MAIIFRSVRVILDSAMDFFSTHTGNFVSNDETVEQEINAPDPHLGQDKGSIGKDYRRVQRSIDQNIRKAHVEAR